MIAGRQSSRTVARRPEIKRWTVSLSQVVCATAEPKLSSVPNLLAQRQVCLTNPSWKGSTTAGCKAFSSKGGNHTPEGNDRLERCEEEEKAALARVGEEVPKPGDNPVDRPLEPQDRAKIFVARTDDHATDAAREARLEAADAQMTETREVGEHKLVEMNVEVADVESPRVEAQQRSQHQQSMDD